ncbi:MAG: hypothetical protein WCJ81_03095 [bacterium]
MKKTTIMILAIISSCSLTGNAQIENVATTSDSTFSIDKVYAGMLAGPSVSTTNGARTSFTTVRFGAAGTYHVSKTFSVKSWGMAEQNFETNVGTKLVAFYANWQPTAKWCVQAGEVSPLTAQQHRPSPISGSGQFETWTEGRFPGMGEGVNIMYTPAKDRMLGVSIYSRHSKPEYQATLTYKKIKLTGFYQEFNQKVGGGVTYDGKNVFTTLYWQQDNVIADIFVLQLSKAKKIKAFCDFGYDMQSKQHVRLEPGFLKGFDTKLVKGLISFTYDDIRQTVNGYIMITL